MPPFDRKLLVALVWGLVLLDGPSEVNIFLSQALKLLHLRHPHAFLLAAQYFYELTQLWHFATTKE
jgi:hypothetical protein